MRDRSSFLRFEILVLVARIAAIVLLVEVAIMLIIETWEDLLALPKWALSLIDAALLVLISVPILYAWVIRPYVVTRDRAESAVRQVEAELLLRNRQFDAALQNMHHGLAMYDAEQRLIVCNERYAKMYGFTPDEVRPGTTFRQLLETFVAKGSCPVGNPEEYIKKRLAAAREKRASSIVQDLPDGRVFAISHRPTSDGGWVATHEDITERQLAEKRLKEADRELITQRYAIDQAVIVGITDVKGRITYANEKFCVISGYTREELLGNNHRILDSGIHGKAFFRAMYRCIARGNVWRGEICNKAKDGSLYWVDTTIVPRLDENGKPAAYMAIRIDISAQKAAEEALQDSRLLAQHAVLQLQTALANMVEGICMFDAEQKVVVCNERYARMYGLSLEDVKPGTTLRQIVEHRIALGIYAHGDPNTYIQERLAPFKHASFAIHQLSDGRAVAIARQPMAGGGWVTTHKDVTEQQRAEARIAHMARHDALTGLPNRVLLNEQLDRVLLRARRGELMAIHLLDLDRFKNVNDSLGHPAGDKLLTAVADRLRTLIRETDTIARMGGDEFAIIQVAIPQLDDARSLAERVIEAVGKPYDIDGHQCVIGTSVGIAVAPVDGDQPDKLTSHADLALYCAKADKRGSFRFFEPSMDAQMQARHTMESGLRHALINNEFELFYQPIVNLERNEIAGCEALIRWCHPEKGVIAPAEFISLAEESGLIVPIGEWVIRQACATAAAWPDKTGVSINLSAVQFRSPRLLQVVVGALAASGLPPARMEFEITETALMEDKDATLAVLYQLRELGVRIALDDFGTGYSSLSYLQSFPFDKIKIDRSFIADVGAGGGSLNIVRAVAALANSLGMTTTAEGVETEEQLEAIRSVRCTEMQGFLFSRPLPTHEIEQLLRAKPQQCKDTPAAA